MEIKLGLNQVLRHSLHYGITSSSVNMKAISSKHTSSLYIGGDILETTSILYKPILFRIIPSNIASSEGFILDTSEPAAIDVISSSFNAAGGLKMVALALRKDSTG